MTTPTQDQLQELFDQEFRIEDPTADNDYIDRIWHWITTVYDQKVREEDREWIGIYDRKGNKVHNGDIVGLPYIPPFGGVGIDDPLVYKAKIVFKHATYMLEMIDYDSYTENIKVIDWLVKEEGEYVSNYGNKRIIKDVARFEVLDLSQLPTLDKDHE